jgi:hypothetical protein
MPDLAPLLQSLGILIGNLMSLEYSARAAISRMTRSQSRVDLSTAQPGDWVPEDPIINYDQLSDVLIRFNELAFPNRRVDKQKLVDVRHQLAHGRILSVPPEITLLLLKFDKPTHGRVKVSARIDLTENWLLEQRRLVDDAQLKIGAELVSPRGLG